MKFFLKYLILTNIIVIFFISVFTARLNAADGTIYESISRDQLFEIMLSKGYNVIKDDKAGYNIIWTLHSQTVNISIIERDNSINFYTYIPSQNIDNLEFKINEWNKTKRFSRCYHERNGEPVLEIDYRLNGGVTEASIKNFLDICDLSLSIWLRDIR